MVWLSGDFSSTQMKRSGCPTWSLMSSNAIGWALFSVKSRQLMMVSSCEGKCVAILVHAIHADSILETCVRYRGTTANGHA